MYFYTYLTSEFLINGILARLQNNLFTPPEKKTRSWTHCYWQCLCDYVRTPFIENVLAQAFLRKCRNLYLKKKYFVCHISMYTVYDKSLVIKKNNVLGVWVRLGRRNRREKKYKFT